MKKRNLWAAALSMFLCALCVVPFLYVLASSFRSAAGDFTMKYYYEVFIGQTQYLYRFWKSMGLSLVIALGQVIVSALAGFAFAKYRFPGKYLLFFILMILMILPVQVTLMPNFIVLQELKILDTYAALALPAIILPLGTFILTQSFRAISGSVVEAAKIDGCKLPAMLLKVVLPMSANALICVFLLSFLDAWDMVEQPMTYLKDFMDYPISVALAAVPPGDPTVLLTACVLVTLPPLALFAFFNRELTEGIALGGEK